MCGWRECIDVEGGLRDRECEGGRGATDRSIASVAPSIQVHMCGNVCTYGQHSIAEHRRGDSREKDAVGAQQKRD